MSAKGFRTDVILSVVHGRMLAPDFGMVHECIEYMAGGPVWTHQIPSWFKANKEKLREAFPDLEGFDVNGVDSDTHASWAAEREHILSEEREVPVIGGQPGSPLDGLDLDKTVVVAV